MSEHIALVIVAILGAGGPLVTWINLRSRSEEKVTPQQVETAAIEDAVESSGIADRWREYADGIEARLTARLDAMEGELSASRKAHRIALQYAGDLRQHIYRELPPPPPDWPEGIHYP